MRRFVTYNRLLIYEMQSSISGITHHQSAIQSTIITSSVFQGHGHRGRLVAEARAVFFIAECSFDFFFFFFFIRLIYQ